MTPVPYSKFRTGLTFAKVARMHFEQDIYPAYLRYQDGGDPRFMSRRSVLWRFRQIKQAMYAEYVAKIRP